MKTCENCLKEHDGSYASGRFCSNLCAKCFSTKAKRKEINEKVSKKLRFTEEQKQQSHATKKHAAFSKDKKKTSLKELSSRTIVKVMKRMNLSCFICGWYHPNVSGDIHHIIPRKHGGSDDDENLTYICPNCHRMVHSGVIDASELISIKDYVGDSWKDFYYTKE